MRAVKQTGAVLYVALIMLVLMALLGIAGMRVTTLQERMSADYRSANVAFQNTEATVRSTECSIENTVNRTNSNGCGTFTSTIESCDVPFSAANWADTYTPSQGKQIHVRLISPCITGFGSIAQGRAVNEDSNPVYEIAAYNADGRGDNAADAAVTTILRP